DQDLGRPPYQYQIRLPRDLPIVAAAIRLVPARQLSGPPLKSIDSTAQGLMTMKSFPLVPDATRACPSLPSTRVKIPGVHVSACRRFAARGFFNVRIPSRP